MVKLAMEKYSSCFWKNASASGQENAVDRRYSWIK